jgi:L-rhamnose-H+ transport protein
MALYVSSGAPLGILEIVAGGVMGGSFAIGMKYARRWAWENIWLVYSVIGLLLLPVITAYLTVPNLPAVYQAVPFSVLLATTLFGFGWGIANVLCGLAFPRIGIALAVAIVVGLSASLGSLIPLIFLAPAKLTQLSGICVMVGVFFALVGIGLLGWARRKRETVLEAGQTKSQADTKIGLILCLSAGLLAPMLNFSFAFGSRINASAIEQGASLQSAVNAIWLLALFGGFISNAGYCVFLLVKKKTGRNFFAEGTLSHWGLAASMGILWTVGLFCYGWGANLLGDMKAIVGWPVFQTVTILASTGVGVASGEWKGAPSWFVRSSCIAIVILLVAIVFISAGNNL